MRRSLIYLLMLPTLVLSACSSVATNTPESETTATTVEGTTSTPHVSTPSSSTTTDTTATVEARTLLAIGDWGAGTKSTEAIARAMEEMLQSHPYDRILTTGDNFYNNNISRLFEPFEWTKASDITWWASWGNHDIASNKRIAAITTVLGDAPFWVKHEWGPFDVIILDSNRVNDAGQLQFLKEALASNRPAIVAFHHPAFSCSKHGSTPDVVALWVPLFVDDGDVVLVLNGHDHNYQRFADAGIQYVVTGGGGRGLYDLNSCPVGHPGLILGEKAHHFLRIDADEAGHLTVSAFAPDGTRLDRFTIEIP